MAQAPTYAELDRQKAAQSMAANEQANQMATQQGVQNQNEATKNPILAEYMSRGQVDNGRGLGNPNQPVNEYAMIATEVANNSANESEYTQNMIALANAGKLPREVVMSDPVVQQVMGAQQAPVQGLGQIQ